jgi:hypothetical protein
MRIRRGSRPARVALSVALALLACGAAATAQTMLDPANRPQVELPRTDIPFTITPGDFRTGDLTPEQLEALQAYDDRLFEVAREIRDPALRATTLNRMARSKIIARDLEDAHAALDGAAQAAMQLPPGLPRDLRLIGIITNLIVLAHEQVVKAVPNTPALIDDQAQARPAEDRDAWLNLALDEWRRAGELAKQITNPNYRSEQLTKIVIGQASDALKVGRDAGRTATTRPDLEGEAPALYAFADRVLGQATDQGLAIDRAVWSDQALYEVAVAAGRAGQFTRALRTAEAIARPTPRAEALIRIAESMSREGTYIRADLGMGVRRSYQALLSTMDQVRVQSTRPGDQLPDPLADPLGRDTAMVLLPDRIENLATRADMIRRRALELEVQAENERRVESSGRRLPMARDDLAERCRTLAARAAELGDAIADLRVKIGPELDRLRGIEAREGAQIARVAPAEDDPVMVKLKDSVTATLEAIDAVGRPIEASATVVYHEAARSIAAVELTDLRAVSARLLTESLINVGRFEDARAATSLLADQGHRFSALGDIAESQGRRGLADSALRWIERDAPPGQRAALYRRLEEGILATVDQIRTQSTNAILP